MAALTSHSQGFRDETFDSDESFQSAKSTTKSNKLPTKPPKTKIQIKKQTKQVVPTKRKNLRLNKSNTQ